MIEKIEIYWGADRDFESATESLENAYFLTDVIAHINKTDLQVNCILANYIFNILSLHILR